MVEGLGYRVYLCVCVCVCVFLFSNKGWTAPDRRWLQREMAERAKTHLWNFIRGYLMLATWSFLESHCLFVLIPKLHYLVHLAKLLEKHLSDPTTAEILNPALFATPEGEDFVGKISRPMRYLNSRTAALRRLQVYLVELKTEWGNGAEILS